ncbi:BolA family transcriptional regulator [Alphaproteobacteria bacterium]|nr:BolA family transcriptional regulator [Alphaproteobacteria bacterium]
MIAEQIKQKLEVAFQPQQLEVRNVSHQHQGHAQSPETGESHFEVLLVSQHFQGMSRLARQRAVYDILKDEMQTIHALSLELREA